MDANFITSLYIKDNTKFGKSQICGPMESAPRPALAGHFWDKYRRKRTKEKYMAGRETNAGWHSERVAIRREP